MMRRETENRRIAVALFGAILVHASFLPLVRPLPPRRVLPARSRLEVRFYPAARSADVHEAETAPRAAEPPVLAEQPKPITNTDRAPVVAADTPGETEPSESSAVEPVLETPKEVTPERAPERRDGAAAPNAPTNASQSAVSFDPVRFVEPEYPEVSRAAGESGETILALTVGRRGRVENAVVVRSSGFAELDRAARRAALLWRFPRERAGQTSTHRFSFRLEE